MKPSPLAAGLKAAAGRPVPAPALHPDGPPTRSLSTAIPGSEDRTRRRTTMSSTVLIGGHFPPEVRRTLLLVQAESANSGKNLKMLLGEAINDLCVKYGKPQPYAGEE